MVRLVTEDPEDVFDETARLPGIAERNSEVELDELDELDEVVEVVVSLSSLEQPAINKAKQRVLINTKYTVRIVPPSLKMNTIYDL